MLYLLHESLMPADLHNNLLTSEPIVSLGGIRSTVVAHWAADQQVE